MKNEKGFTFIELIAVIGILFSIFMLTIPTIAQTISDVKQKQYREIEMQIRQAAEIYVQENRDNSQLVAFDEEGFAKIRIENLLDANLLKKPLLDPRDNQNMQTGFVTVSLDNDKVFAYDVIIGNETGRIDSTTDNITIIGNGFPLADYKIYGNNIGTLVEDKYVVEVRINSNNIIPIKLSTQLTNGDCIDFSKMAVIQNDGIVKESINLPLIPTLNGETIISVSGATKLDVTPAK